MKKNSVSSRVSVSGLLTVLFLMSTENLFSQTSVTDFEGIKGTLLTHTITDKTDTLWSKDITEFRDEKGVTLWFSREILLNVCLTGICRMVQVQIYWTGASTYFRLQTPDNYPLTKADHSEFKSQDYEKLDLILSDTLSMLKRFKIEDLTVRTRDPYKKQVDGYSGATIPSLSEYVVKDAVFTCYTLWHTVYGSTWKKIRLILDQRTDNDYLKIIFDRKNPQYLWWAIDYVGKHPDYHPAFYHEIMKLVVSNDVSLSQKALDYFSPALISNYGIQIDLANILEEASPYRKFEIIMKFSTIDKVCNDAILILLEQFGKQKLSSGLLGYVSKMIRPENMEDNRIRTTIKNISNDKNLYVRSLAQKLLSDINN